MVRLYKSAWLEFSGRVIFWPRLTDLEPLLHWPLWLHSAQEVHFDHYAMNLQFGIQHTSNHFLKMRSYWIRAKPRLVMWSDFTESESMSCRDLWIFAHSFLSQKQSSFTTRWNNWNRREVCGFAKLSTVFLADSTNLFSGWTSRKPDLVNQCLVYVCVKYVCMQSSWKKM